MDDVIEVINAALKRKGLSDAAASKLAVGHPSLLKNLRMQRTGEKRYNLPALKKLAEALDLELYFGPRRAGSSTGELVVDDPERPHFRDEDFALVPRLDIDVSAGGGLVPPGGPDAPVEYMAFARGWLSRSGINPAQTAVVRVRGDSMVPTIPDGALVLVDRNEAAVRREGIFAFSRDGAAYVKRILPVARTRRDDLSSLVIVSDNPLVPTEVLQGAELDDIHLVGRVRCVLWTL